jgi:transcriptional regulator with XRE-family HTH domain
MKAPTPRLPEHLHHLGDHLRRRRLELGLNRTAMAKRLGIDVSSYCRWEKGVTIPELHRRDQIAAHLGYRPPVPVPPDAPLGVRARGWRVAQGLTITQAARRVGVDAKTLGTLERGGRVSEATREAVRRLVEAAASAPGTRDICQPDTMRGASR